MIYLVIQAFSGGVYARNFSSPNWMGSLFEGIAYVLLCYIIGWALQAFNKDTEKIEAIRNESDLDTEKTESLKIRKMFYQIREKKEEVAFSVLKLRAEARMLESLKLIMLFYIVAFFVSGAWIAIIENNPGAETFGLFVFIAFALVLRWAFHKGEKRAWKRYCRSVIDHYDIMF